MEAQAKPTKPSICEIVHSAKEATLMTGAFLLSATLDAIKQESRRGYYILAEIEHVAIRNSSLKEEYQEEVFPCCKTYLRTDDPRIADDSFYLD